MSYYMKQMMNFFNRREFSFFTESDLVNCDVFLHMFVPQKTKSQFREIKLSLKQVKNYGDNYYGK